MNKATEIGSASLIISLLVVETLSLSMFNFNSCYTSLTGVQIYCKFFDACYLVPKNHQSYMQHNEYLDLKGSSPSHIFTTFTAANGY